MITMKHPHEALGMTLPVGRRFREAGRASWMVVVTALCLSMIGTYLYQINAAATKTFALREREKQLERLQETVSSLEADTARVQTLQSLEDRVQAAGYVPVDHVTYIAVPSPRVALAK